MRKSDVVNLSCFSCLLISCLIPGILLYQLGYKNRYNSYHRLRPINVTVEDISPHCNQCWYNDTRCPCCGVDISVNFSINQDPFSSVLYGKTYTNLSTEEDALKWGEKQYPPGSDIFCYYNVEDPWTLFWEKERNYYSFQIVSILLLLAFVVGVIPVTIFCLYRLGMKIKEWFYRRRNNLMNNLHDYKERLFGADNSSFVSIGEGESCNICTNRRRHIN